MLLESFQYLCFFPGNQFTLDLCKGKMHSIVMMQLLRANLVAESKPKAVQHVNLLGSQVRSVGTQVEYLSLRRRDEYFKDGVQVGPAKAMAVNVDNLSLGSIMPDSAR